MDTISELCTLLEAKKELFLRYEEVTLAMLDCGMDDVEHYITERDKIATDVEAVVEEMARLCAEEPGGHQMLEASEARVDFAKVPSEYHCLYYGGQAVRSIISRIMESDKQVVERLRVWRDEALEAIRQNQNMPKIKKYLTDLTDTKSESSLTNNKA